jgi:hypothetical protein
MNAGGKTEFSVAVGFRRVIGWSIPHISEWWTALLWGISIVTVLRVVLGLSMAASWLTVRPFLPVDSLQNPSAFGELPLHIDHASEAFLNIWVRWDAVHYLNLAYSGYSNVTEADSVFYPLYPTITGFLAHILGNQYILSGLIISTIAAIASFTCLYWLAENLLSKKTAKWTLLALASFPTALFLIAPFTESLFLALTLGLFVAAYKGRWWLAAMLGFLASLTRGPGLFTALALAWIAWEQWRNIKTGFPSLWYASRLTGLAAPVLGAFAFHMWRDAMCFAPFTEIFHNHSGLKITNPVSGLLQACVQWSQVHDLQTTLDLGCALLFLALIVIMIARPRWRKPEWLLYIGANMSIFLSKESFVASSLQSTSRYVLVLFPVFMIIGDWLSQQSQRVRFVYLAISGICLIVLSMLYPLWVFIG